MKKYDTDHLVISLIIPVRNDPEHLRECLQGVMESTYSCYECIVVDDGSSDETPVVAEQFPVRVVKLAQTHGPAYARNRGAAATSGEVLFFIDADVRVYPDTLSRVAGTFTMHPEIDALIGSYDDDPGDSTFISQYKNLFHHYVHQNSNEDACTFWSGCGAIRREVFSEFGGFDVSYGRPAIEDIELGFRLMLNNHKILLQKQIQVKHLKRWTFWGLVRTDILDRGIPWTILMLRDRTFPKDLNLRVSQRISVLLVYILLFSAGLLAMYFRVSAIVLLLALLLGLISYQAYVSTPQQKTMAMTLTLYGFSVGSFLFVAFGKLPYPPYGGMLSIFVLTLALLVMYVHRRLNRFFLRNKSLILPICIGYTFVLVNLLGLYYHGLLLLPFLMLFLLILVNHRFYRFFIQKRGLLFAMMVIPLHTLYYFYSGISLVLGVSAYLLGRRDLTVGGSV